MTYTKSVILKYIQKSKKTLVFAVWFFCFLTLLWISIASTRIFIFTKRAETLINNIVPYEQNGKEGVPDILIIGDSAAYGTGSSSSEESLIGLIGQHFPEAKITNKAKNGTKTQALADRIEADISRSYDIIVIIVGANDIIHPEVNLNNSKDYLSKIYSTAALKAKNVITITTGDFKHVSFFLYPLNYYFSHRSAVIHEHAIEESSKYTNVHYVDTFANENSPVAPRALEAADHLHLSDLGASYWFQKIRDSTNNLEF